jgi:hypothetical protein
MLAAFINAKLPSGFSMTACHLPALRIRFLWRAAVVTLPGKNAPAALLESWRGISGRCGSLQDLIFECHAFGVIFFKPFFRGVYICEHLEMIGIADLFARVDVDQDCH